MKKLFLVLGLVTVLLASCCNNNQKGAQKCDGKEEQKCEQKCDGHNHEACNHDHQNCEKKCEQKCDGKHEHANCEHKAEGCQGHNH